MVIRRIGMFLALCLVAGCGAGSAPQYATETSNVPEVTKPASTTVTDSDTTVLTTSTTSTTTSTTSTTTSTTMPPTTTTVLDTLCIKLTQCQYANLVGVDFSRLQLDYTDFSVATLIGANFTGTNLTQSLLIRADLSNANFLRANLTNANLTAALMSGANLEGANLTGTILCDVDLKTVVGLTETQLAKAKKFKTKGKVYCP